VKNKTGNIFTIKGTCNDTEVFDLIFNGINVKIERIISSGQKTPNDVWLSQNKDEWVILLQGNSRIKFRNGKTKFLKSGTFLFIPRNTKHRVDFTSKNPICIWLAIHMK